MGRGDRRTGVHTGRRHDGSADRRGAATDGCPVHRDGDQEAGPVVVPVDGRPDVGPRLSGHRRRAGEDARVRVEGEPGGQGRDGGQPVDQGAIATDSGGQGQGRDHRPGNIGPGHLRRGVESRHIVIGDRHRDAARLGDFLRAQE